VTEFPHTIRHTNLNRRSCIDNSLNSSHSVSALCANVQLPSFGGDLLLERTVFVQVHVLFYANIQKQITKLVLFSRPRARARDDVDRTPPLCNSTVTSYALASSAYKSDLCGDLQRQLRHFVIYEHVQRRVIMTPPPGASLRRFRAGEQQTLDDVGPQRKLRAPRSNMPQYS
jgi:hypothetical protein